MKKILKYPLVAKTAIWYNARRQDIRRRLAERPVAPTEWNTTVVAEEAMCPKGKTCSSGPHVLIEGCAAARLRGMLPLLRGLTKKKGSKQ
jgi:hypothetical protein